ncbi:hypothetical protein [Roseobacter weihaiensis]|uniref:hypothetical protein n=1 Tax=Roseobacter weihaiensis TaxID=2763262 RepID=UPI001D0BBD0B|nr:hypothetical protein [Roseobacter sp. H9]
MSCQTHDAAVGISNNIETLTDWISVLGKEATGVVEQASDVLENTGGTDTALGRIKGSITSANKQAQRIAEQTKRVETKMSDFAPALSEIENAITGTSSGIERTHERILNLIDTSETIVQSTALLGESSTDASFLRAAQPGPASVGRHGTGASEGAHVPVAAL